MFNVPNSPSALTPEELQKFLGHSKPKSQYDAIIVSLRRRQLVGGHSCAKAAVEIIRYVLGTCKFYSSEHRMKVVRAIGHGLMQAAPAELTIGNVVRRVLYICREEHLNKVREIEVPETGGLPAPQVQGKERGNSLTHLSDISSLKISDNVGDVSCGSSPSPVGSLGGPIMRRTSSDTLASLEYAQTIPDIRQPIMASVNELIDEFETINGPICEQALDYVHVGECVLVYGGSAGTVELFLKWAGKRRKFQLIIVESYPTLDGYKLATSLSKTCPNISVTLIPDACVYAIMSRVNKVILAPVAVMADGGAICNSGHMMVANAAKEFSVPVVAVASTYLLTPLFAHSQDGFLNQLLSPSEILPYNSPCCTENVEVIAPAFDYLDPSLINLYVTNNGSHQPSYVYRLMAEYYHPLDYVL